jgi:predicted DCC family thiol-disulfide oxidoreductase YuxK
MSAPAETILFYDGLCGLCDQLVQFLLKHDSHGRIYYVALQSDLAKKLLMERGVAQEELLELSTVYFLQDDVVYRRSGAVLRVVSLLPAPWSLAKVFLIIPPFLADPLYRLVANLRYRIFGRLDQCRIPSPAEKKRFLA